MTKKSTDNCKQDFLASAETRCQAQGVRLTEQRRQVIQLLLDQTEPQSAYQLLDQFKQQYQANAQPPTMYRALDFLVQQGFAHRLSSTNQYVPCDHISCSHGHQDTVFLLCDGCGKVQEAPLDQSALNHLQQAVNDLGFFTRHNTPLELHGHCAHCTGEHR